MMKEQMVAKIKDTYRIASWKANKIKEAFYCFVYFSLLLRWGNLKGVIAKERDWQKLTE